jgi:hypothetical protein
LYESVIPQPNGIVNVAFLLKSLFETKYSAYVFSFGVLVAYVLLPMMIALAGGGDAYMQRLAWICALGCLAILAGFHIPFLDRQMLPSSYRISLNSTLFWVLIWGAFAANLFVALLTADKVPLVSAWFGATAAELSEQRASFFKTRQGWEYLLNYANALITAYFIPFTLALAFLKKDALRWAGLIIFVAFCELTLEKALFLKALLPFLYLASQRKLRGGLPVFALITSACLGLIFLNTVLSKGSSPEAAPATRLSELVQAEPKPAKPNPSVAKEAAPAEELPPAKPFFSAGYTPVSSADFIVWRIVAVPVFTATDALKVFDEKFGGQPLLGATSSLLAKITGRERVPFEALVHGRQWGGGEASPNGRANSVFLIEGYVNFGIAGVIIFGLVAGLCFRLFWKSDNEAFKSIWPLFAFAIFASGMIGNMLSNGLVLFLAMGLFVRLTDRVPSEQLFPSASAHPGVSK